MLSWPLQVYRVEGESMLPAYASGDTLLGWRWFAKLRAGQVVVAERDGRPIIKRIAKIEGRSVWLAGDNPGRSTDSRHFGPLNRSQINARIIATL
jgi:phage repressor protein C with HTH and peptisase S24 domain